MSCKLDVVFIQMGQLTECRYPGQDFHKKSGNPQFVFKHAFAVHWLELRTGNFAHGWSGAWLAARRKLLANNPQESLPRDVALPRDLEGKTVLLGADGGIENELFFLRYAPQLKAHGARVLYRASADTELLLRHRPVGLDAIVSQSDAIPPCEGSLYVSALPLALAQPEAKLAASLRLEPNAVSPNTVAGHNANAVSDTVYGAAIGGGGNASWPNRVTDDYSQRTDRCPTQTCVSCWWRLWKSWAKMAPRLF